MVETVGPFTSMAPFRKGASDSLVQLLVGLDPGQRGLDLREEPLQLLALVGAEFVLELGHQVCFSASSFATVDIYALPTSQL